MLEDVRVSFMVDVTAMTNKRYSRNCVSVSLCLCVSVSLCLCVRPSHIYVYKEFSHDRNGSDCRAARTQ